MRIVVALGGNAILRRHERGLAAEQRARIREASDDLAVLAAAGNTLVVTHGNGPQVGAQLVQNQAARERVPAMPLDVLVAETQGQLGYMLQEELAAALRRHRVPRPVATLITQVVVDPADPAFLRPTKPIGPYLSDGEADELRHAMVPLVEMSGKGWRRAAVSPRPIRIVEEDAVRALVSAGVVPIAGGGGGVPVVEEGNGYRGVEAVVDKDLTAALLADVVEADALLILTDVDRILLDRGTQRERPVSRLTVAEARTGLADGQFSPGSMGPKIEAALAAVGHGHRAVVASLECAVEALAGEAGTEIVP